MLAAFAAGCGSDPNGNDAVTDDPPVTTTTTPSGSTLPASSQAPAFPDTGVTEANEHGLMACPVTRTPIESPDAALLVTVDRLVGSYPIGGTWGAQAQLEFTQKGAPFEGELVLSRRDGDLVQLGDCGWGIEVPVAVAVRTNDGALAERVDGTVLLTNPDDVTIDGSPAAFRAELSAVVDLGALSGSLAFSDASTHTVTYSALRAELTPFGTRGMLGANIEPKETSDGVRAVSPLALVPLLAWDGGEGCVGSPDSEPDPALFPAPTQARAELDATLEMASAETYRAKYADGTETQVAVEFDPLELLCATNFWASYWHFPTRVRLSTDDGRLDVSIGVTVNPGFARLHYNELTEVPWVFPSSLVEEQIGHIDVPLAGYAHVGIESWFGFAPEPYGWIRVLGWNEGACGACDESGGCSECAFDQRVEILNLAIGSQTDEL